MSYHFHNHQLLNGAYGNVWLAAVLTWWTVAVGTPWALPPGQAALLAQYVAEGTAFMTFNGVCDWAAVGRGLDRPSQEDFRWQANPATLLALAAQPAAQPWAADVAAYAARIASAFPAAANGSSSGGGSGVPPAPLVGNRHVPTIDYHAHHRAGWGASLKMHGDNGYWTVLGNECDNLENTRGEHEGDGVLNMCIAGWQPRVLSRLLCLSH